MNKLALKVYRIVFFDLTTREQVSYALMFVSMVFGLICFLSAKFPANSNMAAWAQAIGSVVAVSVIALPAFIQKHSSVRNAKTTTLAAVETAWGFMQESFDRTQPDYDGSEWHVIQWDVIRDILRQSPIHDVGSAEALSAFVSFSSHINRAEIIDEPTTFPPRMTFADRALIYLGFKESPPEEVFLSPLVSIMSNASQDVETLRRVLR